MGHQSTRKKVKIRFLHAPAHMVLLRRVVNEGSIIGCNKSGSNTASAPRQHQSLWKISALSEQPPQEYGFVFRQCHSAMESWEVEWECYWELPGTVGVYVGTTLDLMSLVKGHCSPKVNVFPVGIH
ncbi:hypothetical protein Tco_0270945 [Tanacetum coccineum]